MYICTSIHLLIYTFVFIVLCEFDIIGPSRFFKINIPVRYDFLVCISNKLRYKAAFLRPSYSHKSHSSF